MSAQKKVRVEADASDGPLDYVEEDDAQEEPCVDSSAFIAKIRGVTEALDAIDKQAEEEMHAVEERMLELYRPTYRERAQLLADITDFYRSIFSNHPALTSMLSETDLEILQHVVDMEVEVMAYMKPSFSVKLILRDNTYLWNTELSKSLTTNDEGEMEVSTTAVEWKNGKGDNQASDTVEGSNKRRLEEYSFFDWFEDSSLPAGSDYQNDPVCVAILELWKRPEQYYLTGGDEESEMDSEEPMIAVTSGDLVELTAHPSAGMYGEDTEYVETEGFDGTREGSEEDLEFEGADDHRAGYGDQLDDGGERGYDAVEDAEGHENVHVDYEADTEQGIERDGLEASEAGDFVEEQDLYEEEGETYPEGDDGGAAVVYEGEIENDAEEADAAEAVVFDEAGVSDPFVDEYGVGAGGDSIVLEAEADYAAEAGHTDENPRQEPVIP